MAQHAVAVLRRADDANVVCGVVFFDGYGQAPYTQVAGRFSGLTPGQNHGLHIHMYGDERDGCESAGPHLNPTHRVHGGAHTRVRHLGDMGNVYGGAQGDGDYRDPHAEFTVAEVVGRALVLHQHEDDLGRGGNLESRLTGNSGPRMACGVIGWRNTEDF